MMKRQTLDKSLSAKDFVAFYWLKKELITFCKAQGIDYSGGKIEITARIFTYLETGVVENTNSLHRKKSISKFNWNTEILSPETVLTDNYKNTENVRLFFITNIGSSFHFTTTFMKWLKQNEGKTLKDAIAEWIRLNTLSKNKGLKTDIAPQFEYNRFVRDFLSANPGKSLKHAIIHWKRIRNEMHS